MKQMLMACMLGTHMNIFNISLLDGYNVVAINIEAKNQVEQKNVDAIKSFKINAEMLKKECPHFPLIKKIDFLD